MTESSIDINAAVYRDRRAGLIVFGILEIGIGALCALMIPMMFLAGFLAPEVMSGFDRRTLVMGPFVYGTMATVLIWLGIGSLLCRRWARTLLLILSWSWLLMGISMAGVLAWLMRFLQPGDAAGIVLWIVLFILVVFGILLPGAMIIFYRSPHVQATCEARDPRPRWTEACPSPVLTNSLWLGLGAAFILVSSITGPNVVPMFGFLQTGAVATVVLVLGSVCLLYLAYATYRLRPAGWWGTLIATILVSASWAATFARVDLSEFYRKSGTPEQQIEQINNLGLFPGRSVLWLNLGFSILFVMYLLWLRKYFRKTITSHG